MTAAQLLRLYPGEWQKRYGDEFLATVGDGSLNFRQIVDILSGAIDAWLSSEVRRNLAASTQRGEVTMHQMLKTACAHRQAQLTTREALTGAGLMLAGSFLLATFGIVTRRSGWPELGEAITSLAFPVSMTLAMWAMYLRKQPWKAQLVIVGGTLAILGGATYLATLI
jgi:hypothetical protein